MHWTIMRYYSSHTAPHQKPARFMDQSIGIQIQIKNKATITYVFLEKKNDSRFFLQLDFDPTIRISPLFSIYTALHSLTLIPIPFTLSSYRPRVPLPPPRQHCHRRRRSPPASFSPLRPNHLYAIVLPPLWRFAPRHLPPLR